MGILYQQILYNFISTNFSQEHNLFELYSFVIYYNMVKHKMCYCLCKNDFFPMKHAIVLIFCVCFLVLWNKFMLISLFDMRSTKALLCIIPFP